MRVVRPACWAWAADPTAAGAGGGGGAAGAAAEEEEGGEGDCSLDLFFYERAAPGVLRYEFLDLYCIPERCLYIYIYIYIYASRRGVHVCR